MDNTLRWAALQPLTGGMYFGAEKAFGHPAEFIISFPGFNAPKVDKNGEIISGANEYHLCEYLKKKNRMVPYYQFNRTPFQLDDNLNPEINQVDGEEKPLAFDGLDVVVAVPVCAGLSGATSNASDERKGERNCNMIWLAKFALNTIKPKVYIFENAPRFTSSQGAPVRAEIEQIAREAGYSICYYHTDSNQHRNCQNRPRTFIFFFRIDDPTRKGCPQVGYENLPLQICEVLDEIPKDATQQVTIPMGVLQSTTFDFIRHMYGENWRQEMKDSSMIGEVVRLNKVDEYNQFIQEGDYSANVKKRVNRYVEHIKDKHAMDKGFYAVTAVVPKRGMPSCMFKTMPNVMHYSDDRLYTLREWMTVMGMPFDFEMQGDILRNYSQIGQNVPAKTAEFITSEAVKIVEKWDIVERGADANVLFVDNVREKSQEWLKL